MTNARTVEAPSLAVCVKNCARRLSCNYGWFF